jgi:hypothetical protein
VAAVVVEALVALVVVVATSGQLLAITILKKTAAAGACGSSGSGRGVGSGSAVGASPSTPRGGVPVSDRACWRCGQTGHQKATCTNPPLPSAE